MARLPNKRTPVEGVKLRRLVRTCDAFPSQWDAWEQSTGHYYYIRYRGGHFSVEKTLAGNSPKNQSKTLIDIDIKDMEEFESYMTDKRMLEMTGFLLSNPIEIQCVLFWKDWFKDN